MKYQVKHGYEIQIRFESSYKNVNNFLKNLASDEVLDILFSCSKVSTEWTIVYQRPRG